MKASDNMRASSKRGPYNPVDMIDERIQELRGIGIPFGHIARILMLDHGKAFTESWVKHRVAAHSQREKMEVNYDRRK